MKNLSTFLLLFCLSISGLSAQQVFVLYEPGCMLRVQYEHVIARQPRMDYFAYQVPLADGNKIILETGVEGNVRQNYLPPDYMRCNDPRLNAELVEGINGNTTKVFMLVPDGNDYLIQPVTMGAVFARQNNLITYVSPLASFQFDTRNVIIGENLAYNNPNAKVFFEGRESNNCTGAFLVRQLMPRNAYPVIDYRIIPEIGVVERRLGSDGESTIGGVTVARSLNGQPIDQYIAEFCNTSPSVATTNPNVYGQPVATTTPATYGGVPTTPPAAFTGTAVTPTPANNTAASATAPSAEEVETHKVVKGETLYGLSRRYGVRVDQLKEWNNLRSNTINVGQELRVNAPGVVAAGSPVPTAVPTTMSRGPATPQPYQNPATSPSTPAEQQHIVQPGETVASIALKYGYTEAKFREINGLGTNEFIRIGQRLQTDDCNCPPGGGSATTPAGPTAYGTGVVSPQNYVAPSTPGGTPVGPTSSGYRAPTGYQPTSPSTVVNPNTYSPQTYNNRTTTTQPRGSSLSINNDPSGFSPNSAVIPQVYQAPSPQSMSSLESSGTPRIGGGTIGAPTTYGSPVSNAQPAATRAVHVVQEGESLYGIAQRYALTVDQLRQLNGLSRADIIIPFQRLYIN